MRANGLRQGMRVLESKLFDLLKLAAFIDQFALDLLCVLFDLHLFRFDKVIIVIAINLVPARAKVSHAALFVGIA